jgi:TolB-like protein
VFPFSDGGSLGPQKEDLRQFVVGVQQMLTTELQQNPALNVIERRALNDILREQNLLREGRVDPETAPAIGKLIGARYMVTGNLTDIFGTFRLDGRIVDVETGRVIRAVAVSGKRERINDLLVDLASRVTTGVNLPPLPAASQAARKARDIPQEATRLYFLALDYEESGKKQQAIELYRRISQQFPQMTEAREQLKQLSPG